MERISAKNAEPAARESEAELGLLTKSQVAERLNVCPRTLESWMSRKLIPFIKIKKSVRFAWPDVQAALKRNFGVGYESSVTRQYPQ